jgi:hypothetical protein
MLVVNLSAAATLLGVVALNAYTANRSIRILGDRIVVFVFAIAVLVGAGACMAGAGRQGGRSSDGQRLFRFLFGACAGGNLAVVIVAWAMQDTLAQAIGLVTSAFLVLGAFRSSWSIRTMH